MNLPAVIAATAALGVLPELQALEQKMAAAQRELERLEAQAAQATQTMAQTDAALAAARVQQKESFVPFQQRVRALAKMPVGARGALLGGAENLNAYLRATRLLRWVAAHDKALHRQWVTQTERLTVLQHNRARQREALATLVEEARNHRDRIAAQRQERVAMLRAVAQEPTTSQQAVRERQAAARVLTTLVRKLEPRGPLRRRFTDNRGRLPWPAQGAVETRFGQSVKLGQSAETRSQGWAIRGPVGSNVHAIFSGEVVHAGWLGGYGQLIILDHGDSFHTLVAHLNEIRVTRGATVTQGSVVGTLGDTGSLRGPMVYFEIRHQGLAVDPASWLRRE